MEAHLRLKSITIDDPKLHSGVIVVTAATYTDSGSLTQGNPLTIPFQRTKHGVWTKPFEMRGLAIRDFADIPPECNWVIVVTRTHDMDEASKLLTAVGTSVAAMTEAKTVAGKVNSLLAEGLEATIKSLFFKPKMLGTFIGSADRSDLQAAWEKVFDEGSPAKIELAWDVDAAVAADDTKA